MKFFGKLFLIKIYFKKIINLNVMLIENLIKILIMSYIQKTIAVN